VPICYCGCAALSVSLEAEATSAVIAAQALSPLVPTGVVGGGQASPAASSSTATDRDDAPGVHLHCGCRGWSPSTSRSTVVDVEPATGALSSSFYHPHSPALAGDAAAAAAAL